MLKAITLIILLFVIVEATPLSKLDKSVLWIKKQNIESVRWHNAVFNLKLQKITEQKAKNYATWIIEACDFYGVPYSIAFGVCSYESGFVNLSGTETIKRRAYGLMRLQARTANMIFTAEKKRNKAVYCEWDLDHLYPSDLLINKKLNVFLGVCHIRDLITYHTDKNEYNHNAVLASYNAGVKGSLEGMGWEYADNVSLAITSYELYTK